MTRFLAVPATVVVASLLPFLTGGSNSKTGLFQASLYILAETSIILPIMLSSISIGQEGKSISNIYMLPISPEELVNGKLFLSWLISAVGVIGIALLVEFLASFAILNLLVVLVAVFFNVLVQGYIGLGAGSRYPNFTIGPRARFITLTGFINAFALGLLAAAAAFTPLILYETAGFSPLSLGSYGSAFLTIILTIAVGALLLVLARSYCLRGVKKLFSNMEA